MYISRLNFASLFLSKREALICCIVVCFSVQRAKLSRMTDKSGESNDRQESGRRVKVRLQIVLEENSCVEKGVFLSGSVYSDKDVVAHFDRQAHHPHYNYSALLHPINRTHRSGTGAYTSDRHISTANLHKNPDGRQLRIPRQGSGYPGCHLPCPGADVRRTRRFILTLLCSAQYLRPPAVRTAVMS